MKSVPISSWNYAPGSAYLGDRQVGLIADGNLLELSDYGLSKQVTEGFATWKVFIKIAGDTPAGHQFRFYTENEACKFVEYIQALQPLDKRIEISIYL